MAPMLGLAPVLQVERLEATLDPDTEAGGLTLTLTLPLTRTRTRTLILTLTLTKAAIASWLEPHGEAAFAAFYAQRKNYHPPAARRCNATSDNFDECLTCTGGCRAAFACFNSHGTASDDFAACLAANA